MTAQPTLLIIEDGDEYRRFFARHVDGYAYNQARSLSECLEIMEAAPPEGFVLDLRFDRVPRADLVGDPATIADEIFGNASELESAWRYNIDNQGFLILRELRSRGYDQPALLITELPERRKNNLRRLYGKIGVVASFEAASIQEALTSLLT